jgi:hypothetical protein
LPPPILAAPTGSSFLHLMRLPDSRPCVLSAPLPGGGRRSGARFPRVAAARARRKRSAASSSGESFFAAPLCALRPRTFL